MLSDTLKIAAAGMKAQGDRLRVIAENVANADSTSTKPGGEPYRRKLVIFENVLNKELGVETVRVAKRTYDMSDFRMKYDPNHPAANEQGYVLFPNVSSIVEMIDMRESRRAYEANINVIEVSKAMLSRTIELLR
ncbi:MAG: flagellar basal body rod protein FlgC [Rickettsiales bacterium]|jgi:flagellar basal-body rod protein FlgC|nr:flagellar basal body rod protein FlgC [Rickettsiales bacterium]